MKFELMTECNILAFQIIVDEHVGNQINLGSRIHLLGRSFIVTGVEQKLPEIGISEETWIITLKPEC